jgi:hypothetical protein
MSDPRYNLEPGVYRAQVVGHSGLHEDYPPATDDRTALLGAIMAMSREDTLARAWVDYSLPGCGDWVWRIYGWNTSPEFIAKAIERGWFEWEKRTSEYDPWDRVSASIQPDGHIHYTL